MRYPLPRLQGRGRHPGSSLRSTSALLLAFATATAVACESGSGPSVPSTMAAVSGQSQSAEVGTTVPVAPSVRVLDQDGGPVEGVQVTFAVTAGGGSVGSGSATTNGQGIASAGSWTLGSSPGANTLTATASGLSAVAFNATATAGPPATVAVVAGDGQSGRAGTTLPVPPAVRVSDRHGNPVQGAEVEFRVLEGGGTVRGAVRESDATGTATAGAWSLGLEAGANRLEARAGSAAPASVQATATAPPPNSFRIDIRYVGGIEPDQQVHFGQAAARWEQFVTARLAPTRVVLPDQACGNHPAVDETLQDVAIYVSLVPMDGAGGLVARAGPCLIRQTDFLPVLGILEFDETDFAALEAGEDLHNVITHEMGHVLGFGTVWDNKALLTGAGGEDPHFTGAEAVDAFRASGGAGYPGNPVPVENTGGEAARDRHWRKSVLANELLTATLEQGAPAPLSAVTVASLADLGYAIDPAAAEPFVMSSPAAVAGAVRPPVLDLREAPMAAPLVVGPDGRILRGPARR